MQNILIVEDETGISDFLKEGLTEENYQVRIAVTGVEGWQKFSNEKFDLILLDWMLPGITGFELMKKIRIIDNKIPIIFITAKDTLEDTIMALNTGANDYLKKPFSFEELLARIRVQLRKEQKHEYEIVTYGPLVLNFPQRTVKLFEEYIMLTQKEFDLLGFLLRNKNHVCSRIEILEKVWDIHFDYPSGVIDVYINALRKKLHFPEQFPFIETIWGVGYRVRDVKKNNDNSEYL